MPPRKPVEIGPVEGGYWWIVEEMEERGWGGRTLCLAFCDGPNCSGDIRVDCPINFRWSRGCRKCCPGGPWRGPIAPGKIPGTALTAIGPGPRRGTNPTTVVVCVCDPLITFIVRNDHIRRGQRSCGCGGDLYPGKALPSGSKVLKKAPPRPGSRGGLNTWWHCRCSCGKEWEVRGADLINGHTTTCGHSSNESVPERLVAAIVKYWHDPTAGKVKFGRGHLDVYSPSTRAAIEYDGPTHYSPIYGDDDLKATQERDREKDARCVEQDIRLFRIRHDAFQENYIEAVKEAFDYFDQHSPFCLDLVASVKAEMKERKINPQKPNPAAEALVERLFKGDP